MKRVKVLRRGTCQRYVTGTSCQDEVGKICRSYPLCKDHRLFYGKMSTSELSSPMPQQFIVRTHRNIRSLFCRTIVAKCLARWCSLIPLSLAYWCLPATSGEPFLLWISKQYAQTWYDVFGSSRNYSRSVGGWTVRHNPLEGDDGHARGGHHHADFSHSAFIHLPLWGV